MDEPRVALAGAEGFRDVDDLRSAIVGACADQGSVLHVTTICGQKNGKTLCVIDFIPKLGGVGHLAAHLGGQVFGMNSVVLSLSLGESFRCPSGKPTSSPHPCSCSTRS